MAGKDPMTPQPRPNPSFPNPSRKNIETIAKLERDALERRSWTERFSENTVKLIGSIAFLSLNALFLGAWTAINLNLIPGVTPFDRFPFGILALIVSSESIILTIFVLISQNRLMRQSDKLAHLDLQVGLLAEQELTAVVQMLQKLCERAGVVDYSTHSKTFGEATDVHKIARELDEKLPGD
jgi:uncharacterized membrane protein